MTCLDVRWRIHAQISVLLLQVQLKEYVKLTDSIYEVNPKEEQCFQFSRVLKFNVSGDVVCFCEISVG